MSSAGTTERSPDEPDDRDYAALIVRTIMGKGLAFLKSFLVLPLITPAEFGVYRYVLVIIGYLAHLHLGMFNFVGVHYPPKSVAGDDAYIRWLTAVTWQVCLVGGAVATIILLGYGALAGLATPTVLVLAAILVGFDLPSSFVTVLQRVRGDFRALARMQLVSDLVSFAAVLAGTWAFGLSGLLVCSLIAKPLLTFMGRASIFPPGWRELDWPRLRTTMSEGMQLWTAGLIAEITTSLDLMILANLLGQESDLVGYYALGLTLEKNIEALATPVAHVEIIRLSRMAGRDEGLRSPTFATHTTESIARDGYMTILICCLVAVTLAFLIPVALPAYRPALNVLGAFFVLAVLRRWRKYPLMILSLAGRIRWSNVVSIIVLAVVCLGFWLAASVFEAQLLAFVLVANLAILLSAVLLIVASFAVVERSQVVPGMLLRLFVAHTPMAAFIIAPLVLNGTLGLAVSGLVAGLGSTLTFWWIAPDAVRSTWRLAAAALAGAIESIGARARRGAGKGT